MTRNSLALPLWLLVIGVLALSSTLLSQRTTIRNQREAIRVLREFIHDSPLVCPSVPDPPHIKLESGWVSPNETQG